MGILKDFLNNRPDFKPSKNILSEVEKVSELKESDVPTPIKQLMDNAPSVVLKEAETTKVACRKIMNAINKKLLYDNSNGVPFSEYLEALDANNYELIYMYENGHSDDIKGKVEAELYGHLHYLLNNVIGMEELFKIKNKLVKLSPEKIEEMDNDNLEILLSSEEESLSYDVISMDAQVNNGFLSYFKDSMEFISSSEKLINAASIKKEAPNNNLDVLLRNSFDSEKKTNAHDKRKLRQLETSSIRKQAALSMYDSRQKSIDIGSARKNSSTELDQELVSQILDMTIRQNRETFSAILDFHKINKMDVMYHKDFINTIGRKQTVRQFYS